ncbi:MAG: NPCBM/NEW2 domain-containing protein [Candidatus Hydrogenedentes bacterium]|nr:NPCBM/NEW2 domain-containing protein [Candidatus Hydrogenedentota bacterium]
MGVILFLAALSAVELPDVTGAEMEELRLWTSAKFEGTALTPPARPGIEVWYNHGPVQANARGGKPMHLGETAYNRGLYCHAPSKLTVRLSKPGVRFEARAGVDTNDNTSGGRGSVVYSICVGGQVVWKSDVMREGMPAVDVSVLLDGAASFELEVSDAGDGISCDQADWLDAKVTFADGSQSWLGDMPLRETGRRAYDTEPFFSFTYGDRSSREFLANWKLERTSTDIQDKRHGQRRESRLVWRDPATGLSVRCVGIAYTGYPVVEWTLYFKNEGASDTPVISNIQAIDTQFHRSGDEQFVLRGIRGDDCTPRSYEPYEETLAQGTAKQIANTGGRPTQESFPFFNIGRREGGLIYVLSWAGQWATEFERDGGDGLRISGGQGLTHFVLHPGEEVRSPLVVLMFYEGGPARAQNVWRRWMLAHNVPQPGGEPLKTMRSLCNGNYYPGLMTVASKEREFLQRHLDERIGFDCWWQDAGWYPCDGIGWPKVGTWEVDPIRFPKGLRELSDLMHENGKTTMVWFEPERVHAGTWIADRHPEWVHGGKDGGLLKLGEAPCREWLTNHIDRLLTEQGIDYYRQDFNMDPLPFWRGDDAPDRQGITEIRHVEGYFQYWDELLRRHPGMLIDSCASGGRRNDLETLRRAVPLLRSDWYNAPEGQQCLTYGLAQWIPYHGTGFIYPKDTYWIRSSFTPENSFGPAGEGVDNIDFALLRKLIDEHREISPYLLGDFYPLTPYTLAEDQWMAWQFHRPDLRGGVVQVFRRPLSIYESARLRLHGLEPDRTYTVKDLDKTETTKATGAELMEQGLLLTVPEAPRAVTIVYSTGA